MKFIKFLKAKSGDFEHIWLVFVAFFSLALILTFVPNFINRQKVVYLTKAIVEEVEYNGVVDSNTYNKINELIIKYNFKTMNPTYSFSGNIKSDGKIQLRDEFTFTFSIDDKIRAINLDNVYSIPITISHQMSGKSQVYYKE